MDPLEQMVEAVVEVLNLTLDQVVKFNLHKTQVSQIFNSLDLMVGKVEIILVVPLVEVEVEGLAVLVLNQLQLIIIIVLVVLLVLVEQIPSLEHLLHMVEVA